LAGVLIIHMKTPRREDEPVQLIVFGQIHRDFVLTPGKSAVDIPGGPALYFSVGAAVWNRHRIGIISQIGDDFPLSKIAILKDQGIDLSGISILPYPLDIRAFHSGIAEKTNNPTPTYHYLSVEQELPRELLGYGIKGLRQRNRRSNQSNGILKIPQTYLKSNLAHFCATTKENQIALTSLLQTGYPGQISQFISDIPVDRRSREILLTSLANMLCVVVKITAVRDLFLLESNDISSVLKHSSQIKSEYVVVLLEEQGRVLIETKSGKKWFIPLYPIRAVNPTGKNHSFCGGFCSSIRINYDPVEAVLSGAVSSSLVASGIGLNYALEAPQNLVKARLDRLRTLVRCL
jgi:hypothetical protein